MTARELRLNAKYLYAIRDPKNFEYNMRIPLRKQEIQH